MRTVWFVIGKGQQFFCFSRDDVADAIGRVLDLIAPTGDSVIDGPALDALDEALEHFNNPDHWQDQRTYWKYCTPRAVVEAWVIQPEALANALCTAGQRWLEI